jgi:hypothetical protein
MLLAAFATEQAIVTAKAALQTLFRFDVIVEPPNLLAQRRRFVFAFLSDTAFTAPGFSRAFCEDLRQINNNPN